MYIYVALNVGKKMCELGTFFSLLRKAKQYFKAAWPH